MQSGIWDAGILSDAIPALAALPDGTLQGVAHCPFSPIHGEVIISVLRYIPSVPNKCCRVGPVTAAAKRGGGGPRRGRPAGPVTALAPVNSAAVNLVLP